MASIPSNWFQVLCIYVMLFHMFGIVHSKVAKFKLLLGRDVQINAEDETPHIRKEFFLCGRDQSCTHVVELSSGYVLIRGSIELEGRKQGAVRIYEKVKSQGKSTFEMFSFV